MALAAIPTRGDDRMLVRYDLTRLRGLSDCVFAVAITIQAVIAAIPAVGASREEVEQFLTNEAFGYAAYVGCFALVGYIWLQHHRIFGLLRRVDLTIVLANAALMFGVVILPFLGRLSGDHRTLSVPHLISGADVALIGGLLALIVRHSRSRGAFSAVVPPRAVRILLWRCGVLAGSFLLSALLSILSPGLNGLGWPLLLVGSLVVRRRLGRIDEADVGSLDDEVEVDEDEAPAVGAAGRQLQSLARITGFSDNVYAFAMTVVVIQLRVPADAGVISESELLEALRVDVLPVLVGYLLGYAVITLFWVAHCRYFMVIVRHGTSLPAYNLLHLMVLATLPFASLLFSDFLMPVTAVLYSVFAGLTALGLSAVFLYAARAGLLSDALGADELARARRAAWAMPLAFLATIPIAAVAPAAAGVGWVLAGLSNRRLVRGARLSDAR
jgi:uncharacterized membrane protein